MFLRDVADRDSPRPAAMFKSKVLQGHDPLAVNPGRLLSESPCCYGSGKVKTS